MNKILLKRRAYDTQLLVRLNNEAVSFLAFVRFAFSVEFPLIVPFFHPVIFLPIGVKGHIALPNVMYSFILCSKLEPGAY